MTSFLLQFAISNLLLSVPLALIAYAVRVVAGVSIKREIATERHLRRLTAAVSPTL